VGERRPLVALRATTAGGNRKRAAGTASEREQLKKFSGLLPESQDHNLVLTVVYVPSLLEASGIVTTAGGTRSRAAGNLPLSSEYGTYKTVTARCWPWLLGKGP